MFGWRWRVPARDRDGSVAGRRGVGSLLAATAVSIAGDGAFITAVPLLAASLTESPAAVATVTAATYVPWLLFGLPAGVLADRWPKRLVLISTDLFRAAVLGLFCVLLATGSVTVAMTVVVVLTVGAAQCFFEPAAQSVIPALVGFDKETLDRTNGRFVALTILGRAMIGPLLGAWIFTVGRVLPFMVDAVSFVVSAIFVSRLPRMAPTPGPQESMLNSIKTGFRHLHRSRELTVLALGLAAYNFGYWAVVAVFVLYSDTVLHVGPIGYGAYFAILAGGGVLSGWFGTRLIRSVPATNIQAATLAVQGIAWTAVVWAADVWVTGAAFLFIGTVNTLNTTAISTSRQRLAPEQRLGLIVVVFRLYSLGASGIGSLVGGWVAQVWGLSAPMIAAMVIQLAAAVVVWMFRS